MAATCAPVSAVDTAHLLAAVLEPLHPDAARLVRGILAAKADTATLQAAAAVIANTVRDRAQAGHPAWPAPPGKAPVWSYDAAFVRARDALREEADESGIVRDWYVTPETATDAAETCAVIAAIAAARDWAGEHRGETPGRTGLDEAVRLAAEQVAYVAAARAADLAARQARDPQDEPAARWESELAGTPEGRPDNSNGGLDARGWTARLYQVAHEALAALTPALGGQTPTWRQQVTAADTAIDDARELMEAMADERARAIHAGVQEHGPGGRAAVARILGVEVLAVDRALRRARMIGAGTRNHHA